MFLLPALSLTTRISVGLVEVVLLLAALGYCRSLWRLRSSDAEWFAATRWITLAFLFNLLVATASLVGTGFDARFFENPSKMLLAALMPAMVLLVRPRAHLLWFGLSAGTIGAALFAVYQRFVLLMPRAEGFSMPITFGDIAMAMGLMSLAGIQVSARTRWAALPYLSFVAGVVASILSGSRGGWLAFLLSVFPLYTYGRHAIKRRSLMIIAASVMAVAAVGMLPQTGMLARMTDVSKEIDEYNNGNPDTSVGARIEMWKGSWLLFAEHPLTGVGRANYNAGLHRLIARGVINPAMQNFQHAHNEMLNAMATQGLPGALALLGIYAAPLLFFSRQLRRPGLHRSYALAGLLLVLSFIDFGLTQVMFAHHVGSAFYALSVCLLAGLCLQERQRAVDAPEASSLRRDAASSQSIAD